MFCEELHIPKSRFLLKRAAAFMIPWCPMYISERNIWYPFRVILALSSSNNSNLHWKTVWYVDLSISSLLACQPLMMRVLFVAMSTIYLDCHWFVWIKISQGTCLTEIIFQFVDGIGMMLCSRPWNCLLCQLNEGCIIRD